MKWSRFGLMALLVWLGSATVVLANDVAPPPWRGEPKTTHEDWSFTTSGPADAIGYGGPGFTTNLAPDVVSNYFGSPALSLNTGTFGSGWYDNSDGAVSFIFGSEQGFWDIGNGSMSLTVPNLANADYPELVQFQITYFAGSTYQVPTVGISPSAVAVGSPTTVLITNTPDGEAWYTEVYTWQISPSPSQDTITVQGGSARGSIIDEAIVDTQVTNIPPVATVATYNRPAGLRLLIALSDLPTHWSDAEGYPVTLTGLHLVTANGVNLATNGTWILYTNSPNVNDQFSYSISDGEGGTNVGLVNVVIVTNVTGQAQTIEVSGNSATVSFAGLPGYTYNVQRSTNLTAWVTIWTTNAPGGGLFQYRDTFSDLGGVPTSAYYRLNWSP